MLESFEHQLGQVVDEFRSDLAQIRTGRAVSTMVEDIKVEAYPQTVLPLKEVASISIPEPRQILIAPWDKATLEPVEKALRKEGFNPASGEGVLRINLSPLTHEDRERIAKEVGGMLEEAKVKIRLARREAVRSAEDQEKSKQISEDEAFSLKKKIDEINEKYTKSAEELAEEKRKQILGE